MYTQGMGRSPQYRRNAAIAVAVSIVMGIAFLFVWSAMLRQAGVSLAPQNPLVGQWVRNPSGFRSAYTFNANGTGRFDKDDGAHGSFSWFTSGSMLTTNDGLVSVHSRWALSDDRKVLTIWEEPDTPIDYQRL